MAIRLFPSSLYSFTLEDLVPFADIEKRPSDGRHSWEATGPQPTFIIQRDLPSGWYKLKVELRSDGPGFANVVFEPGPGTRHAHRIGLGIVNRTLRVQRWIRLDQPTRSFRLHPLDEAGPLQVVSFQLKHISPFAVYLQTVLQHLTKGKLWHKLLKTTKLLATCKFKNFRSQLVRPLTFDHEYQEWQRIHHPRRANLESMTSTMSGWSTHPVISVIVPVFNPPLEFLTAAIASVRRQIYPYWELCIADDCSTDPKITSYLVSLSSQDLRIKVVFRKETGNISKATNSALDLATGEYAAFLDHDDELAPHALYHVAKSIVDDPAIDMIYTDEDKINEAGEYSEPFFKPDWSPEYMLACMYTCHLSVYRTFLVRQVGGLDSEFDTAQDYHLALRIIARQPRIHHIAHVLYHWRIHPRSAASGPDAKPGAHIVNRKALESFLVHSSPAGRVEAGPTLFFHRARYDIIGHPKISIVIPTASKFIPNKRRQVTHVQECVESIVRLSTYSQFEILVIHECDMPVELQRCLENLGAQLVPYDSRRSFNFSRTINHGVCHATGEYVTLMNDDIEVKSPDWMESMLEFGQLAEVGAVGCKLLFPTGTIQHAGVVILEAPRRPYYQSPEEERGYCHTNSVHRNVSAVTGACMMTKTDLFRSVGGFAEEFPLNYSDVDYCLKIRKRGKRIVYTPYPALYHHESATRMDGSVRPWELELFKRRWPEYIFHDPYYSPNLSRTECYTRLNLNEPCEVDATAKGTKAA